MHPTTWNGPDITVRHGNVAIANGEINFIDNSVYTYIHIPRERDEDPSESESLIASASMSFHSKFQLQCGTNRNLKGSAETSNQIETVSSLK